MTKEDTTPRDTDGDENDEESSTSELPEIPDAPKIVDIDSSSKGLP
jgi:hypothetical protein